jgi:hypothetical protein
MTIGRSIKSHFPGLGDSVEYVSSENVNNPINATTTTNLTGFRNPIRSGLVSIRGIAYPGGGAGQCTAIVVKATDGTTTQVLAVVPSFAASDKFNLNIPFGPLDFDATTVSVSVTMANVANGQLTADFEVAAVP